jgi:hypothetical protein
LLLDKTLIMDNLDIPKVYKQIKVLRNSGIISQDISLDNTLGQENIKFKYSDW